MRVFMAFDLSVLFGRRLQSCCWITSINSSVDRYAQSLKILDPFIGDLPIRQIHQGTLEKFIQSRRKQGLKANTINRDLAVVRRILNLAARLWRDESGLTWLETAPLLQMLDCDDARKSYPLN